MIKKLVFVLFSTISIAHAGGVGLGATRLIFDGNKKQASLEVRNTSKDSSFLIQSWIENEDGKKSGDFIITPPLYVSQPQSENILRVIFNASNIPSDKESLYWITVKAIPQEAEETRSNTLQFATANRIKLIYRPVSLKGERLLQARYMNNSIRLINNSPYYQTIVNLNINGQVKTSFMLAPGKEKTFDNVTKNLKTISYQFINDFGSWSEVIKINVN